MPSQLPAICKVCDGRRKLHLCGTKFPFSGSSKVHTAESFTAKSHSSFCRVASGIFVAPVNRFHAEWKEERRGGGGGGRIALSAISMALLTNRIGVNKLELFPQRC